MKHDNMTFNHTETRRAPVGYQRDVWVDCFGNVVRIFLKIFFLILVPDQLFFLLDCISEFWINYAFFHFCFIFISVHMDCKMLKNPVLPSPQQNVVSSHSSLSHSNTSSATLQSTVRSIPRHSSPQPPLMTSSIIQPLYSPLSSSLQPSGTITPSRTHSVPTAPSPQPNITPQVAFTGTQSHTAHIHQYRTAR